MGKNPHFEVVADGWVAHDFPGVGLYDWDVRNDRLSWSPELIRIYGLTSAPTAEEGFLNRIHFEDRLRVEAETAAYLESGASYEHEFRIVRPNGEVRHLHDRGIVERDFAGSPVRIRGINVDLTEIDVRRDFVRTGSLRSLTDAHTKAYGAYAYRPGSGRSEWSPELRAMLGLSDAISHPNLEDALSGVHPGDRERVRGEMYHVMRHVAPFEIEYRVIKGDGTVAWIQDRGHCSGPIDPETGLVDAVHGFLIDVTAQRVAEARLEQAEAHLRTILENTPAAIAIVDSNMDVVRVSRRFLEDVGVRHDEVIGRQFHDVWPQAEQLCRSLHERALLGLSSSCDEEQVELPSGRIEWVRWATSPWHDAFFEIRGAFLFAEIISEQVAARQVLAESQERLADALRAGELGVHDFDPRTGELIWDGTVRSIWGVSADERITYETFKSRIHPDDLPAVEDAVSAALDPAGTGRYEAEYRVQGCSSGEYRWIRADGMTYFDEGTPVRLVGTVADVTCRKLADEQLRYLMRELGHRTKNLITLFQAIARNIARTDPEDFLSSLEQRLAGLASSQNLLIDQDWRGVDLSDLIRAQLLHFEDLIGNRITISGPKVTLSSAAGQTLGMAFHELATNAAKYGALSTSAGNVDVSWTLLAEAQSRPGLKITWQERGGPPVIEPSRTGFGTTVLTRLVKTSIRGRAVLDYEPSGLRWVAECGSSCFVSRSA